MTHVALPKFQCPICDAVTVARVINGRMNYRLGYYWRQLRCTVCQERYTTKEIVMALNRPGRLAQYLAHNRKQAQT